MLSLAILPSCAAMTDTRSTDPIVEISVQSVCKMWQPIPWSDAVPDVILLPIKQNNAARRSYCS